MPQAPYVNWEALLKQVGDSMNMPGMAQLIDKQALVQMQQQAAMQQQAEAMAQQGSVDDRGTSPQEYAGAV